MTRQFPLIVVLVCLTFSLFGQQKDAVLLTGFSVEKKINKQISATFLSQYGLNENYSELGYMFFDGGLNWRVDRNWTVGINYRLSEIRNLQNFYQERQLLYGDITYTKSKRDFTLSLRTRFQVKYYGLSFSESDNYRINKHFLRNKATLRYRLDPENSVYVSEEQYFRFDTKDKTDAWRTGLGIIHQFNLHHRIDLGCSIYQRVNTKTPDTDYITSLTYYFRF